MYLRPNEVEVLHMEWTSRCPLFCQQCARTDWEVGKAVMPTLPMGDMKPDFVDKILPQFPNVDVLHVCGNYGDIIAYPYLLETLDIVNKHEIPMTRLYTNGSARTTEYWEQVAKKLKGTMTFSIDGLEDTNHIYRVGSNWNKVMESAKAFIDAGGYAIWEMLVFEHNQHQVEEAKQLSEQMGFKRFRVKRASRFTVYDKADQEATSVKPTSVKEFKHINQDIVGIDKKQIVCKYKKAKWIYVSFEGDMFPCCWTGANKYKKFQNRNEIWQLFETHGKDFLNLNNHSADQVFEHTWFSEQLEKSWNTDPLQVCSKQCLEKLQEHEDLQYANT
tara:strand:+ start:10537 stop:11529 length:993 start_codon:yes stop_codon:yes gene_type:complete